MRMLDTTIVGKVGATGLQRARYQLPGGQAKTLGIITRPDAVGVLPVHPHHSDLAEVYLAVQPRPAVDEPELVEVVAGKLDPGETDPQAAAARELAEEAGLAGDQWRLLARDLPVSPGYSTERMTLFAAWDLHPVPARVEDAHIRGIWLTLTEALDRIDTGHITDLKTITAVLLTHRQLAHAAKEREQR